jgi:hypothetical protein
LSDGLVQIGGAQHINSISNATPHIVLTDSVTSIDVFKIYSTGNSVLRTTDNTATNKFFTFTNFGGTQIGYIENGGMVIGSSTRNTNLTLDLQSTTMSFGLPLLSTTTENGISATVRQGMVHYNTTSNTLRISDGTVWNSVITGSGLTTNFLPKYNGTALVNSALSETATDINATSPINDSSATVASASIINLPQIYNIITGTVNITEIRGAGGITVQNGAIRVLRFSGILNIGGGNPANRVDNGVYGIIATRVGDTAVYRKETNDWVLQSYKRSDGSPLTLGAYLNLTDSSATVTNVNPIQPVQLGLFQTPDSNRGFLMFQNGQANQLLRPYEGEFWANTGDGGYLSLWDGRRIASPANGGNASVNTSIARYATNNNGQKIEVNIFSFNSRFLR